jgi:hypothetical protein
MIHTPVNAGFFMSTPNQKPQTVNPLGLIQNTAAPNHIPLPFVCIKKRVTGHSPAGVNNNMFSNPL